MTKTENPMAERPMLPLLLSMSMPVVLSMFIQALYNIVDSMWVARLGTEAITAVSLAYPLQNISMSPGRGDGHWRRLRDLYEHRGKRPGNGK